MQVLSTLALISFSGWFFHGIVFEADYWKAPIFLFIVGLIAGFKYSIGETTSWLSMAGILFGLVAVSWIFHGLVQENEIWKLPFIVPTSGIVYMLTSKSNSAHKEVPTSSPRANTSDEVGFSSSPRAANISPRHPNANAVATSV